MKKCAICLLQNVTDLFHSNEFSLKLFSNLYNYAGFCKTCIYPSRHFFSLSLFDAVNSENAYARMKRQHARWTTERNYLSQEYLLVIFRLSNFTKSLITRGQKNKNIKKKQRSVSQSVIRCGLERTGWKCQCE